jgi:hypothetical protein
MEFKTAFTATESRTVSVSLIDVLTFRALLRSVPSVYKKHMFPESFGLVLEELFKLVKRPAIKLPAELFTSSLLDSDFAQVFESKHRKIRVCDLLRYAMVHISHKPFFLAGETPEFAFSRLGAFRLQLFPKVSKLGSGIFNLLRVVKRVIGADSDVHDTSINPENFEIRRWIGIVVFKGHVQIERFCSPIIGYRGRFDFPCKIVSIVSRYKERGFDSAFGRCNRSNAMDEVHGDYSLVIPHSSERLPFRKCLAFRGFQSFASAISCSLHQGRWKIRNALTDKLVGCIVVVNFVPRFVLESPPGGLRERLGISLHGLKKRSAIIFNESKLECYRPKHVHIAGGYMTYSYRSASMRLLPTIKDGVSGAEVLR